jgi:hypothetical protein
MAEELPLPEPWASQGWKAKIRDREGPEEPHVTILHGTRAWRFSIRRWRHLDDQPPTRLVPEGLLGYVHARLSTLIGWWDRKYPNNPVQSPEEESKEEKAPKRPKRKRRKK